MYKKFFLEIFSPCLWSELFQWVGTSCTRSVVLSNKVDTFSNFVESALRAALPSCPFRSAWHTGTWINSTDTRGVLISFLDFAQQRRLLFENLWVLVRAVGGTALTIVSFHLWPCAFFTRELLCFLHNVLCHLANAAVHVSVNSARLWGTVSYENFFWLMKLETGLHTPNIGWGLPWLCFRFMSWYFYAVASIEGVW